MDKSIIKNQISYWESQQKDMEGQRKVLDGQISTVKATIKALRALLPKEKSEPVEDEPILVEGVE